MRGLILAISALLLTPVADAQQTEYVDTTLYFHIFDTFNKFPINTQPYNASFFDVGGTNFPTVEGQDLDLNTIYGYSSAGPVEYQFIENGRPRVHEERGIAADVEFEPNSEPVVYLYIDPRGFFGDEETPGVLPGVTFSVTMREGDDVGSDLEAGSVIMQGETTVHLVDTTVQPTDWLGVLFTDNCPLPVECPKADANDQIEDGQEAPDGHQIRIPNDDGVIELVIPMDVQSNKIVRDRSFNIQIEWYQTLGGVFGEDEFAQGNMRLVLDESYLPRLDLRVANPVRIVTLHPQVAAGILLIHSEIIDSWGTYDIDYDNITVDIAGPSEATSLDRIVTSNQHVHGKHHEAAEVTYLWRFRDDGAADGDYTITMRAPNLAGNAIATKTATFIIDGDKTLAFDDQGQEVPATDVDKPKKDSPAPGGMLALALAAALLARRRP